jgi:hypothetical protein
MFRVLTDWLRPGPPGLRPTPRAKELVDGNIRRAVREARVDGKRHAGVAVLMTRSVRRRVIVPRYQVPRGPRQRVTRTTMLKLYTTAALTLALIMGWVTAVRTVCGWLG